MDTLIRNGYVLTMDRGDTVFPSGCVAVSGSRILYAGEEAGLPPGFKPSRVIDARGGVVMPGFVNAHTHLAMTLLRGLGGDLALQDWLEKKIWPAEDGLTAEHCYWGSLLGLAEMIRTGTTAFLDMYFFMEQTARAVEETGMRAVLSRGLLGSSPNFGRALAEAESLHRDFNGAAGGRITVMLGPHAEYTCSLESIEKMIGSADKLGCGLHVHLQETVAETAACVERHGESPAKWFDRIGLFGRHVVAAHCVTVDGGDIEILARNRVHVAHCPGSNMKLASGIAPVRGLVAAGVNVALGTDGAASNNNLDMPEEIRLAALCAKIREKDPTALQAYGVLKMGTAGGAGALGIDTIAGSIEVGKEADIIIIEANSPSWQPRTDIFSNLVYASSASDVSMTMVGGAVLMENSQIKGIDLDRVYHETNQIAAELCR